MNKRNVFLCFHVVLDLLYLSETNEHFIQQLLSVMCLLTIHVNIVLLHMPRTEIFKTMSSAVCAKEGLHLSLSK